MLTKRTTLALLFFTTALLYGVPAEAQTSEDCLMCHEDTELTTERNGREISLFAHPNQLKASPHAKLNCVACHVGFNPEEFPHKENIRPVKCTSCHKDAKIKHKFHTVMLNMAEESGDLQSACKDCHGKHDVLAIDNPKSPWNDANLDKSCSECHGDVVEHFDKSAHGIAMKNSVQGAPNCIGCHSNAITEGSGLDKLDLKVAQEHLCLSCHMDNQDVRNRMATSTGFINAYEHSVHGNALHNGNGDAANCVDCHGAHDVSQAASPTSKVSKKNVPHTCGQCHTDVMKTYDASIHGQALIQGVADAPACIDCHGEHNILNVESPDSPVQAKNLAEKVCLPCHSSVQMADKYGIVANPGESYLDSYHGLAMRGGSKVAANCASCHGYHDILPSSDPASSINKANLQATCGKCHPNASESFSEGPIHVVSTKETSGIQYLVTTIYVILIILTIGGMAFHNVLDFRKKALEKLKARRRGHVHDIPHNLYLRMSVNERIQHAVLAISFIILVFTGFGLTYPNAWWVEYIRTYGGEWAFQIRGILHRIAGAIMVAISLYHIFYIAFVPRGRQFIKDMMPKWQDVKDVFIAFNWYLGRSEKRPQFERFSYAEKAEYWALIWGTIVMGITGTMLWFHEFFGSMTSKEFLDIMTIIHFYEAWLATLAIIVWHFYFIIFNPDIYPMNVAWFKGTLTELEMEEEHPLELARIKAKAADIAIDTSEVDDDEMHTIVTGRPDKSD